MNKNIETDSENKLIEKKAGKKEASQKIRDKYSGNRKKK